MLVIIVAEKPSITQSLLPVAREHWPTARIIFVNTITFRNIAFTYPRGLCWHDFPHLGTPTYRRAPWPSWLPREVDHVGALTPCEMSDKLLRSADEVVFACDPDHTGVMAFTTLINEVFGPDSPRKFPALYLPALDRDSLREAFRGMADFCSEFAPSRMRYGQVKHYFDWNWNLNALAVLGTAARSVGIPADAPPVSKYALQVLYYLADQNKPIGGGSLYRAMAYWKGTGKHTAGRVSLGSLTSYSQILENLTKAGLIASETEPPHAVGLTPRGRTFLAALHKDCKDLDLPFRLAHWGEQGFDAAKPAMDQYLRTFFGKQKRKSSPEG